MTPYLSVFFAVFLAELGDKTQIAAILFAADGTRSPAGVFAAASAALVASTGLAVFAGAAASRYLADAPLKLIAGAGFILIGALMLAEHFRTTA